MELEPQAPSATREMPNPFPSLNVEAFLRFSSNPQDTSAVFDIQKALVQSPGRAEMIKTTHDIIASTPEFVQLFNEMYIPRFPSNEELMNYPEGSLGRATGVHLTSNGIQLDFAGLDTSVFYNSDIGLIGYLGIRGIRTHDIYHTVLGRGVTPIDEYAVASFTLAQFASPYHMLIVSSGYVNTAMKEPHRIPEFLSETHKFYELGRKAKPFIGFKYEEHWATPLREVREMLGVGSLNDVTDVNPSGLPA